MMKKAAIQALEVLQRASDAGYSIECDEAITALQAAIDAPKPLANVCKGKNCGSTNPKWHSAECFEDHDMVCGSAKPVGYVRHYAIQHLSKPGHTVINHEPQDTSQETPDVPLYLHPPAAREPLPSFEIVGMYDEQPTCDADMIEFARAIEAAHGIGAKQ